MVQFNKKQIKDIGLDEEVFEALPYAVVGGAYEGSLSAQLPDGSYKVLLSHIVPAGHQLKILFLRIWTQEIGGARFSIVQTNPTLTGQTGAVEAFPVVGSVPQGVRDYPMLEAAGAEVLHGSLVDPIHVLEGSIDFRLLGATPTPATGSRYGLVYWGVEKIPKR
jgi:hypothetical protein